MKITSYIIAHSNKNVSLAEAVNKLIDDGYQPYCGPYLDRNGLEKQAIVKYEEPSYADIELEKACDKILKTESKPKKKGRAIDEY